MKQHLIIFLGLFLFSCNDETTQEHPTPSGRDTVNASPDQTSPFANLDASPMDMLYYPVDFPKLKMANSVTGNPDVRIIYSRPRKSGRKIFGELLHYGQPWRLGANESTEIQLFRPAFIQDKKIDAGRYIMYCIPQDSSWTIILNTNTDSWGLQQDQKKDIAKFQVPVERRPFPAEYFTMSFEQVDAQLYLIMTWDDLLAKLPFRW